MYLMPENDSWKDKAMMNKSIRCPKFVKNNEEARKKFILDECQFHWLDPIISDKLATKFNNVILNRN